MPTALHISQLASSEYEAKKGDLVSYHKYTLQILDRLDTKRANKMVDALVNLAATLALGA